MSLEKKIRKLLKISKKGEVHELKQMLSSQFENERKSAIKKVIQHMSLGKDVSYLFPDVLKSIATYDLQQKKLVYLYLMNYAQKHPELCILAVNTLLRDAEDTNPLVRSLAIRTMGCIRVNKIIDYINTPLNKTLNDENAYVRKTAVLCVAKLFSLNPTNCIENGFIEKLHELLKDSNSLVVVNTINALYEIKDMNKDKSIEIFKIDNFLMENLLFMLNDCTEWGRLTLLNVLKDYESSLPKISNLIIVKVYPQLQHANPAIVLSSVTVILKHLKLITSTSEINAILNKISVSLVSLIGTYNAEIQYVTLRNIKIILEKYPDLLSKNYKIFFIKYSDPLYLKLEKIEIIMTIANDSNIVLFLNELKEYVMEFEPSIVTKSIKCVGSLAVNLPSSTTKSVNLLSDVMEQRKSELVISECVIQLTNIIRKFPKRNDLLTLIIPTISKYAEFIDKKESFQNYIWILGEYSKYFTDVLIKIKPLVNFFLDYETNVQLAILTTVVKISLNFSGRDFQKILQEILEMATKCENTDVRDRAFIYWRLLSLPQKELHSKVINPKFPPITTSNFKFDKDTLETLLNELSLLSSVYHKKSSTFVSNDEYLNNKLKDSNLDNLKDLAKKEILNNMNSDNLLEMNNDQLETNVINQINTLFDDLFNIQNTSGKINPDN